MAEGCAESRCGMESPEQKCPLCGGKAEVTCRPPYYVECERPCVPRSFWLGTTAHWQLVRDDSPYDKLVRDRIIVTIKANPEFGAEFNAITVEQIDQLGFKI